MVNSNCYRSKKVNKLIIPHLQMIHDNFLVLEKLNIICTTDQTVENQSSPSEFSAATVGSCALTMFPSN
jgi:hypothetical protein